MDRGVVRAADDRTLNYRVSTDTWEEDAVCRGELEDHLYGSEIVSFNSPY